MHEDSTGQRQTSARESEAKVLLGLLGNLTVVEHSGCLLYQQIQLQMLGGQLHFFS